MERTSCTSFSDRYETNLRAKIKAISDVGEELLRMAGCTEAELLFLVLDILG